ncbi:MULTISPECIES: hypothetical protein [Marinovum]|uniref:hypothetical protein n=1 Tax=Marinovum TaxID=367771 RepID=UPI00237A223C|nr:hypothetical protein [Marinovum sp. PR37]MDD9744761.1 hypothetical protein [Marinovum sp. PR37]
MIEALAIVANNARTDLPPETFSLEFGTSHAAAPYRSDWGEKEIGVTRAWSQFSSSASTWEEMFDSWIYQAHTSNAPQSVANGDSQARLNAISRARSVERSMASENVFEIRRLTGFSWAKIGELLNVDRRTINNWAQGRPVREANQSHVAMVLSAIRYIDRGDAEENQELLERRISGTRTAFHVLAEGNAEDVKRKLSFGEVNRLRPMSSDHSAQPFDGILFHDAADGTEELEALSFEAKPTSSKKALKRS